MSALRLQDYNYPSPMNREEYSKQQNKTKHTT